MQIFLEKQPGNFNFASKLFYKIHGKIRVA